MNIFLWIVQVLLALHTGAGAIWKYSNSVPTVPVPHTLWLLLGVVEIVAAIAMIFPAFVKSTSKYVPYATLFVTFEMIFFILMNVLSGKADMGALIYWAVVAVISGFLAYARYGKKKA